MSGRPMSAAEMRGILQVTVLGSPRIPPILPGGCPQRIPSVGSPQGIPQGDPPRGIPQGIPRGVPPGIPRGIPPEGPPGGSHRRIPLGDPP